MSQVIQPYTKDEEMQRVLTPARFENYEDIVRAVDGHVPPEAIRHVEVAEALVDTGATYVGMPPSMIEALGLRPLKIANIRTDGGLREAQVYSITRVSVLDRHSDSRVLALPGGSPALIGQLSLEDMDIVPVPREGRLIPNPAHGGEWTIEMY